MFEALTSALGRSVELPDIPELRSAQLALDQPTREKRGLRATVTPQAPAPPPGSGKPVLQLASLPFTMDPSTYQGAFGSSNPNGDRKAAFAFRQLVDPLPFFQADYVPNGQSLEENYGDVVNGAQTQAALVQTMLNRAQSAFASAEQASLSGDPNASWRLVEASPPDWWNTAAPGRFRETTLTLGGGGSGDYTVIGGDVPIGLTVDGKRLKPLDSDTKVNSITLKCQTVVLKRSWMNLSIFNLAGWQVGGQPPGIVSSGDMVSNDGLLPLIPVCILVGADIAVNADWGASDQKAIAAAGDRPVSLGPFPVSAPPAPSQSLLYLVGVVSYLTPFSPKG
jgi:hypothetical protein